MNTRMLGAFCVVGGLVYLAGGVWLAVAGAPTDPGGIRFAHLFSLIWAIGGLCGLLGMSMTYATGAGRIARAAIGLPALGLALVIADAGIGLIAADPLSPFSESPSPFSAISRLLLLVGFLILRACLNIQALSTPHETAKPRHKDTETQRNTKTSS